MIDFPFYEFDTDAVLIEVDSRPLLHTCTDSQGRHYIGVYVAETEDEIVDYWLYARAPKGLIDLAVNKEIPLLDVFARAENLCVVRHDTRHDTHVFMPMSYDEIPAEWLPTAGTTL